MPGLHCYPQWRLLMQPSHVSLLWAQNLKIVLAYTPFKDLNNEDFIIMRLHDLILIHMWMGRT